MGEGEKFKRTMFFILFCIILCISTIYIFLFLFLFILCIIYTILILYRYECYYIFCVLKYNIRDFISDRR